MDHYEGAYEKFKELESGKENVDLDDFEEFMRKVEEVNKMVHALTSSNKSEIAEATLNADTWMKSQTTPKRNDKEMEEVIHQPSGGAKPRKKIDKTIINEKAFKEEEKKPEVEDLQHLNSETMSQEAFMRSIEADAKKRSDERKQRKVESDALKMEANKAFAKKDYEKALDLYNKALEVRKDSWILYTNRAITLLNLGLNSRALADCESVLRFNDNFKAAVFKGKAYFQMGEEEKLEEWMKKVKTMFPNRVDEIEEYQKSWVTESSEE